MKTKKSNSANNPRQWNSIYKKKEEYKYYDVLAPHEDMGKIVEILKKEKQKKILDLGCGAGRNLIKLAENGFDVHGIDVAEEGVNLIRKNLRKKNLKAELRVANIFDKLPYKNNFFDGIISVQTLQHGNLSQIKGVISEITRILKPNGFLFVTLCGRYSKGKTRYCLVKTAQKIAPRTYVPTIGDEKGLTHYIYNKEEIKRHYKNFSIKKMWKDKKDYYCFIAINTKTEK